MSFKKTIQHLASALGLLTAPITLITAIAAIALSYSARLQFIIRRRATQSQERLSIAGMVKISSYPKAWINARPNSNFIRHQTSSLRTHLRRWLFLLIVLPLLLLTALPAQAIDYTFPGYLPAGCSGGSGSYTCGTLSLAAGDTISIYAPATVTVNGAFSAGASCQINKGGSASNLNFNVSGAIGFGASCISNANLTSGGAIDIGANSTLSGNITTNIGAVTVGAGTDINGTISTVQGAVTVGAGSSVSGSLTTIQTGAITIGATVMIGGSISTATGGVGIGAGTSVGGSISSSAVGAITLGASITVNGNVGTASGNIAVGANTTVSGLISTNMSDPITLGNMAIINSVCCLATGDSSCVTNNTNLPSPLVCPAPAGAGGASHVSTFDCLEKDSNTPWVATARKPLFTKLVNANFTFDIAALKSDGTLATGYSGTTSTPKSVRVDLFNDTTPPTSCTALASQTPVASQTVNFSVSAAGRTSTGNFNLANAAPILRCRVRECTDSSCGSFTALAPACSSDQFSVRPSTVTLSTSATATAPSTTALPIINGGSGFSLLAATHANDGYAGAMALDTTKLTAQTTTQAATQQSGGVAGILSPATLAVNTKAINATYTEVGYLYLAPGAYRDDTFTAIDSANGDCITSTSADSNLSDTLIGGKYGCSIGNTGTLSFGRFIPDHFAISPSPITAACAASSTPFSYFGQDGFITAFGLMAQNTANGITQNYTGVFAKLNLTNYAGYRFSTSALPTGSNLTSSATGVSGNWTNGSASVSAGQQISRPNVATIETFVTVLAAPSDGEVTASTPTAVGSATRLRYGRLKMQNAYGSELLALPIPLEAQYWTGSYYVTNMADSCTVIPASSIKMNNYLKQLSACKTQLSPAGSTTLIAGKLPAPGLILTKPGAKNAGSVDLTVNISTSATDNTCVSTTESAATSANIPWFGINPASRATFGLYKSSIIYQREMY
ncbi:hypothetical protein QN379_07175 [Glaciimonas sp. Gout2]|uniref:DUF6701 domain-containing protein n=1 Tax=unclassified Glaciimonas TaxID=2644401 RepID=UPI002B2368D7|nr:MULTISPECIES: DUF6701 domain-containing protein [unclassified Glaciimonas]MEB0010087.1 hypothetical protein [Glaciimonas sp. Cout2]MEB0081798.1 hypothetical protein [Glaciimonas sp. Gout2]